jgi:hypothetical protein
VLSFSSPTRSPPLNSLDQAFEELEEEEDESLLLAASKAYEKICALQVATVEPFSRYPFRPIYEDLTPPEHWAASPIQQPQQQVRKAYAAAAAAGASLVKETAL